MWPSDETALEIDRHGHQLRIGREQFRNRLLLFFEQRVISRSRRTGDAAALDQLKPLIDGASKGVHADISVDDARRLYTNTVALLAEIARHDLY